jgi:sporulation protein YlmC with PRC-barrel domain
MTNTNPTVRSRPSDLGVRSGGMVLSASTLSGDSVRNTADENLGDIKDLMIDIDTGNVAYAVLSFGGWLGMGDKLFAVPWSAFTVDTTNKCLILNVPKERFKGAPGFDKDNWPNFADPEFATRISDYYH